MHADHDVSFDNRDKPLDEVGDVAWQFNELIKILVALASSREIQMEIGGPYPREDLAIDFETYYTSNKTKLLENDLLCNDEVVALDLLDNYLEKLSGEDNSAFWFSFDPHPDWEKVCELAISCLKVMGKENLKLKISSSFVHSQTGPSLYNVKTELFDSKDENK